MIIYNMNNNQISYNYNKMMLPLHLVIVMSQNNLIQNKIISNNKILIIQKYNKIMKYKNSRYKNRNKKKINKNKNNNKSKNKRKKNKNNKRRNLNKSKNKNTYLAKNKRKKMM